jgi:hypothetical protein
MPKVLFVYLITAAFIGWTLAAPLLAKYNTWVSGGQQTAEDEADMAVQFRVLGAIGSLLGIVGCVVTTVAAIR